MANFSYTIQEIDRMRAAISECQFPDPWRRYEGMFSIPDNYERDRSAAIEDRLRTYMTAGTRPEELEALRDQWREEERKIDQEMRSDKEQRAQHG